MLFGNNRMKLNLSKKKLKKRIIQVLKEQGFKINPHVMPSINNKTAYRQIHRKAKDEQVSLQKNFLIGSIKKVRGYCSDGIGIFPEDISLELREVQPGTFEEVIYRWWNLIWWSIPYQHSYGRHMRFLLWDKTNDAPFGLICLQSPVLKISIRDRFLKIPNDELDLWVNRSMNAQRVGALPPYNQLLGGKMVALALTSDEIREAYRKKYINYVSIIKGRKLNPDLLFITTSSAFGRSSIYNRLKYKNEIVAHCLGYTRGSGTFHFPKELYEEIIKFSSSKGEDIARDYGHGPSRKIRLLVRGLRYLGLSSFVYHGIKREFYLFPLVKNLMEVIHKAHKPSWYERPFDELVDYWKERWAIPRAERMSKWKDFKSEEFFDKAEKMLEEL